MVATCGRTRRGIFSRLASASVHHRPKIADVWKTRLLTSLAASHRTLHASPPYSSPIAHQMPTKVGKSVRDVMDLVPAAQPLPHLSTAKEDASNSVIHRWKMPVITGRPSDFPFHPLVTMAIIMRRSK